jgi:hypothetical protein
MYAYDYRDGIAVRLRGGDRIKVVMYNTLKSLESVSLYERVMINALLSEGGRQGARVTGAVGFSKCTGEAFVFRAKSVVMTTGCPSGIWIYNNELCGGAAEFCDPNNVGDGLAMAWKAGAGISGMDKAGSIRGGGAFAWPVYGVGNCDNTWFPCSLVDATAGKCPGRTLTASQERAGGKGLSHGDAALLHHEFQPAKGRREARIIRDFHERIRSGEYQLPLYADLPGMPDCERRASGAS